MLAYITLYRIMNFHHPMIKGRFVILAHNLAIQWGSEISEFRTSLLSKFLSICVIVVSYKIWRVKYSRYLIAGHVRYLNGEYMSGP